MKALKDFLPEILSTKDEYQEVHRKLNEVNERMNELKDEANSLILKLDSLRSSEINLIDKIELETGKRPTADDFLKIING